MLDKLYNKIEGLLDRIYDLFYGNDDSTEGTAEQQQEGDKP